MNRKTNIFYSEGNDSNFLTFDNYTEALTGDILATDQKLWPSRFLCLYIKALDKETEEDRAASKKEFINKYLVPYYENKLAFLRDNIENSEEWSNILSLNYLLTLIYYYSGIKAGKSYNYVSDVEKDLFNNTYYDGEIMTEDNISLNYISDIVEQDYNGTYADIICTITTNYKYKPALVFKEVSDLDNYYNSKSYKRNSSKLYGWENETNNDLQQYIQNNVIFDGQINEDDNEYDAYHMNSLIDTLEIQEYNDGNLKFNVIIPLFDSQYIGKIKNNDKLILDGQTNVPLGIYFTGKPVELESYNRTFNTNWSLLISMQFKAFPYSFGITHNFDDSDAIKDAYVTFAEVLSKQNMTINNFTKYNNQILILQNKINQLESILNSISTIHNIDDINLNLMKIKKNVQNSLNEMDEKIDSLAQIVDANKLRWKVKNNG